MIGSLRGTLLDRAADEVLVEVAGLGHRVTVAPITGATLGEVGEEVFLHVHHHIREDAQQLFGFTARDDRVCFEALLGAHGVGPALALGILSVHSPAALRQILADEDTAALCLVPGVGKKTAGRLVIELASRLDEPDDVDAATAPVDLTDGRAARRDVSEALAELGYGPDEVRAVVADLPDDGDTSVLLRAALQRLAVS